MSDVDWLALWVEFAQATDNKQIEVAERIVYFDGRLDFSQPIAAPICATSLAGPSRSTSRAFSL
jgi:hypothetical protein